MNDLPREFARLTEQPKTLDLNMEHGVFVKVIPLPGGKYVPQHSHTYPHVTVLVRGSIRVWEDGVFVGDLAAPEGKVIKAGVKHTFQTLTDDVVLLCVHDARLGVEIENEHQLAGVT